MPTVYDLYSFGHKEYDRAVEVGTLSQGMTFYGKSRTDLEAFRVRILNYSRTNKRQHILETTLIDNNHIQIKYTGRLA